MNSPKNKNNGNPLVRADIHSQDTRHAKDIETHLERIRREFADGFEFLAKYPKSVTIFGSSLAGRDGDDYKKAMELGGRIAGELGYAV